MLESVVAAQSQTTAVAMLTKLALSKTIFAVDTGAAVNVLSQETYMLLEGKTTINYIQILNIR